MTAWISVNYRIFPYFNKRDSFSDTDFAFWFYLKGNVFFSKYVLTENTSLYFVFCLQQLKRVGERNSYSKWTFWKRDKEKKPKNPKWSKSSVGLNS